MDHRGPVTTQALQNVFLVNGINDIQNMNLKKTLLPE